MIKRINEEFFSIITKLSQVYNKNYYALVYDIILDIEEDLKTNMHSTGDNKEAVLMSIRIRLIKENYEYLMENIESSKSFREKLSTVSEFEFIQLFTYDKNLMLKYFQGLTTGLNDLYKYISTFISRINQLIQEYDEQEHLENYEVLRHLCPLGRSIFRTIVHSIEVLTELDVESLVISEMTKANLIEPSRFLLELLRLKATFQNGYLFIECTFQEENLKMPYTFAYLPETYEEEKLAEICEYLEKWNLIKYIEDGC